MMKFPHKTLCILSVIFSPPLLSVPAEAQFTQQGPKLVGTGVVLGPYSPSGATQGSSVSLSSDGNTAIVGGPRDQGLFLGCEHCGPSGAAWVFTRAGGVWTQQGPKLVGSSEQFAFQGSSVALSGDGNTAIVGGPSDSFLADGALWVFTRAGGVWTQQGPLLKGTDALDPNNIAFDAEQGWSVALSSDGNTALVGGPNALRLIPGHVGNAWVFTRAGGVWTQQGPKLHGADAAEDTDPSGYSNTHSGWSVSLSADGNTAIVGGPGDQRGFGSGCGFFPGPCEAVGAAWVFTRVGGVWTQQGPKLVGTGAVGLAGQGISVSLSADGNTAMIGGPGDNGGAGAVWVFTRAGGVWIQQGPKLVGTGAIGLAGRGGSVSLSGDGNTVIVGGAGDSNDVGAAWVFTRSEGVWNQQILVGIGAVGAAAQGSSVALSGDGKTAIVGGPSDNNDAGAAWVYSEFVLRGTPGKANCHGQRISAMASHYGGLNAAAAALGFSSVGALQDAVLTFCEQ